MTNRIVQLFPLPWYEAQSYQRVCALMADKDGLFGTYAEWFAAAQRTEQRLRGEGVTTIRVVLDLVQFPAWCAANRPGLHIDAKVRVAYAAAMAAEQYRASQAGPAH